MAAREQIADLAADLIAAAGGGYEAFKQVSDDMQDRYPLEVLQEVNQRLSESTPNPAS